MAEVVLFHHVQGLTAGVRALADELRAAGHTVHALDLYDGQTFDSIEAGLAYAQGHREETAARRAAALAELSAEVVHVGISSGAMSAAELAQTRPGARGAVLLESAVPPDHFAERWPADVPVQVHGAEGDEFFVEDLEAAHALVAQADDGELFSYPGDQHLFTDASLPSYDEQSAALVRERVLAFLARL